MKRLISKKIILIFSLLLAFVSVAGVLSGCGKSSNAAATKTVKVGVVGTTDNSIWAQVNKNLKSEHIHVKLVPFTDGILANQAMNNKELDMVAFQNRAFLENEEKTKHYKFSVIAQTYLTPMNIFSDKIKSIKDLKQGDKISIPNNVTNAGRALKVLEQAGLIKLDPKAGDTPSTSDITENKLKLKIVQQDPAKIMNLLPDVAAGITNSNFVKVAKKDPINDAIYKESFSYSNPANKPWINVIAVRSSDKNNATYKKIVKAYQTKSVTQIYKAKFNHMYTPAFKTNN
ncbi:methionine ABC transporter substrate-binding protein [Secundilactobacillus silagincola]|uniref:Methionine ABC transporter substrate-binding protein n=1 Tax=Secundilactobacillus silagincola TaxID=1714681 RepID=A0A1Z5J4X5_9LACO|nr:MetQ/NlpA family ABC transporter substrate-binding protein [Secundilactobacillus silagincola]GAX08939.1 methionine ABC transporter substrate-binding protein [Secundilactobacillus silagincola]